MNGRRCRTGRRTSTTSATSGPPTARTSSPTSGPAAPSRTPSASTAPTSSPGTTTSPRWPRDTATFSSRVTPRQREPSRRHQAGAAADHPRPPLARTDPPGPAARLQPPGGRRSSSRSSPGWRRGSSTTLAGRELVDGAVDFAQLLPVEIMAHLFGVPRGDRAHVPGLGRRHAEGRPRRPRHRPPGEPRDPGVLRRPARRSDADHPRRRPRHQGARRRGRARGRVRRAPFTERERIGALFVLMLGGIDTTWSTTGRVAVPPGTHPETWPGSSPTRPSSPPPSRSSCATTRR